MTNRIAIWLFLLIAALIGTDLFMGWGGTLYGLRKLNTFLNVMVFWR